VHAKVGADLLVAVTPAGVCRHHCRVALPILPFDAFQRRRRATLRPRDVYIPTGLDLLQTPGHEVFVTQEHR